MKYWDEWEEVEVSDVMEGNRVVGRLFEIRVWRYDGKLGSSEFVGGIYVDVLGDSVWLKSRREVMEVCGMLRRSGLKIERGVDVWIERR